MTKNIVLYGMPGCGKTTLGKKIAQKINYHFIDTDHLMEEKLGMTCRQIFLKKGETYFRDIEHEILKSLIDKNKSLIALGGGTLIQERNVHIAQSLGTLIYLKENKEIVKKQLLQKGIPAYLDANNIDQSFDNLFEQRTLFFETVAHKIIDKNNIEEFILHIGLHEQ